jgi:chromosome segregation ATPase
VDGDQIAKITGQLVEVAGKAEKALTIGGQASSALDLVKNLATRASNNSSQAKEQAAAAKSKADEVNNQLGITKAQLDAASKALAQIDADTREKLKSLSSAQINEIGKLKDDRAKFEEKVNETLTSLKLSDAQIKDFQDKTKGMTPTEILAILTAAAGAAGVGGALGKTGKSRAQPQIDNLQKTVTDLQHTTVKKPDAVIATVR